MKKTLLILGVMLLWIWGACHSAAIPSPVATLKALWRILCDGDCRLDILYTLFRGAVGLALALATALAVGILLGLRTAWLDGVSMLVTASQGCPPVVWLSLLILLLGDGEFIPVLVVFTSTFPVLFFNIIHGVSVLEPRYFQLCHLYRVPRTRVFRRLVLPGIWPALCSGCTYAIGITWKVTSTAEYFSSGRGMGARIQQSFMQIDLPGLFAWTLLLILSGVLLEHLASRVKRFSIEVILPQ